MEINLTPMQAFNATQLFLDAFFKETESDDAAMLLSGMNLFDDGTTWDPAAWEDWIGCLEQAMPEDAKELSPTPHQALDALRKYLEFYYHYPSADPLEALLKRLQKHAAAGTTDPEIWARWMQCVNDVLEGRGPGPALLYKDGVKYIPLVMKGRFTQPQSFKVVRLFLDRYHRETTSRDAAALASNMGTPDGGNTQDAAAWSDWIHCLELVGVTEVSLTFHEAFYALKKFLEMFYQTASSSNPRRALSPDPLAALLKRLQADDAAGTIDEGIWTQWMRSVKDVLEVEGRVPGVGIPLKEDVEYKA